MRPKLRRQPEADAGSDGRRFSAVVVSLVMAAELPTGTVTFLFTDMEGSTRLLEALGSDRYGELLAEHHRVCREAWEAHGGVEVGTAGDAFFVAFAAPSDALPAATAIGRVNWNGSS